MATTKQEATTTTTAAGINKQLKKHTEKFLEYNLIIGCKKVFRYNLVNNCSYVGIIYNGSCNVHLNCQT